MIGLAAQRASQQQIPGATRQCHIHSDFAVGLVFVRRMRLALNARMTDLQRGGGRIEIAHPKLGRQPQRLRMRHAAIGSDHPRPRHLRPQPRRRRQRTAKQDRKTQLCNGRGHGRKL